jgi:hypothetical protein
MNILEPLTVAAMSIAMLVHNQETTLMRMPQTKEECV